MIRQSLGRGRSGRPRKAGPPGLRGESRAYAEVVDRRVRTGTAELHRIIYSARQASQLATRESVTECGAVLVGPVEVFLGKILVQVAGDHEIAFGIVGLQPHPVAGLRLEGLGEGGREVQCEPRSRGADRTKRRTR